MLYENEHCRKVAYDLVYLVTLHTEPSTESTFQELKLSPEPGLLLGKNSSVEMHLWCFPYQKGAPLGKGREIWKFCVQMKVLRTDESFYHVFLKVHLKNHWKPKRLKMPHSFRQSFGTGDFNEWDNRPAELKKAPKIIEVEMVEP